MQVDQIKLISIMRAALVLALLALAACAAAQDTVAAVMEKDNQLSDFYEYAQQASERASEGGRSPLAGVAEGGGQCVLAG